ncbi:hypothetical protein FACS189497_12520 [Betaproteobacteria bacterium]|nr:hypothetical protein FACS189497_12520 [Betaproteobacteria bacterium]
MRWQEAVDGLDKSDWLPALVPDFSGRTNRPPAEWPGDSWRFFCQKAGTPGRGVKRAWDETAREASRQGWGSLPSLTTARNHWRDTDWRLRGKVKDGEIIGILPLLGVAVDFATPANGQSKPVERLFGTLAGIEPGFREAYLGNNPQARPEEHDPACFVTAEELVALVYGGSGISKTETARRYQRMEKEKVKNSLPFPVVFVSCTGRELSIRNIYSAVFRAIRVEEMRYNKWGDLEQTIHDRIGRGGIVIFDEAQSLPFRRMDDIRKDFCDCMGVAVAFMGNITGYENLIAARLTQITQRATASTVIVDHPTEEDVDVVLEAWGIKNKGIRARALSIGTGEGGLRVMSEVFALACSIARAKEAALTLDDFNLAAAKHRIIK